MTVLEARDRIGGRVCDENLGGVCVGKGAQIMNGCTNNPMSVMVEQVITTLLQNLYLQSRHASIVGPPNCLESL